MDELRRCAKFGRNRSNCGVEQRAPPIFGRATITLGIGTHSSYLYFILIFRIMALVYTTLDGLLAVFFIIFPILLKHESRSSIGVLAN